MSLLIFILPDGAECLLDLLHFPLSSSLITNALCSLLCKAAGAARSDDHVILPMHLARLQAVRLCPNTQALNQSVRFAGLLAARDGSCRCCSAVKSSERSNCFFEDDIWGTSIV